jgi:hypothetical protein
MFLQREDDPVFSQPIWPISCRLQAETRQPHDWTSILGLSPPNFWFAYGRIFLYHIYHYRAVAQTGIPLSGSLKRFLFINLGEAQEQRCQLFEPEGRVLTSPGVRLRFIKKRFRTSQKAFGQQPVKTFSLFTGAMKDKPLRGRL